MTTQKATFINNEPKNGYQPNGSLAILVERTVQGKLKVTTPGSAPELLPMIYDKDEDFHKDWRINKTSRIDA